MRVRSRRARREPSAGRGNAFTGPLTHLRAEPIFRAQQLTRQQAITELVSLDAIRSGALMLGQPPTSTLGGTGLEVTRLGFGSGRLRGAQWGGGDLSEAAVGQVLGAVLDSGINFVDTSPDYGVSEERIGRHISHRRQEYILASQVWMPAGHRAAAGWTSRVCQLEARIQPRKCDRRRGTEPPAAAHRLHRHRSSSRTLDPLLGNPFSRSNHTDRRMARTSAAFLVRSRRPSAF